MGTSETENPFKTSRFDKVNHAVKKVVSGYFDKPFYYLFHICLLLFVGASFLKYPISRTFWLIFGFLAGVELRRLYDLHSIKILVWLFKKKKRNKKKYGTSETISDK